MVQRAYLDTLEKSANGSWAEWRRTFESRCTMSCCEADLAHLLKGFPRQTGQLGRLRCVWARRGVCWSCARYDCRLTTARHWHNPHRISLIGRELAASNAASKLCVGVPLPRRSFTCLLLKLMLSLRSAMQVERIAVTFHHVHVVAGPSWSCDHGGQCRTHRCRRHPQAS